MSPKELVTAGRAKCKSWSELAYRINSAMEKRGEHLRVHENTLRGWQRTDNAQTRTYGPVSEVIEEIIHPADPPATNGKNRPLAA